MPYLDCSDDDLHVQGTSTNAYTRCPPLAIDAAKGAPSEDESEDELQLEYPDLGESAQSIETGTSFSTRVTPAFTDHQDASNDWENTNNASLVAIDAADELAVETPPSLLQRPLRKSDNIKSLPCRQLVLPRSRYSGYVSPLPRSSEWRAVAALLQALHSDSNAGSNYLSLVSDNDFDEIELSDFSMYLPPSTIRHKWELRSLQYLTMAAHPLFLFDGVLSVGDQRRYVAQIPFKVCSIGNYGIEHHEVGDNVWIQSDANVQKNVYYRLRSPSAEYARFHDGFMWLANLAKHFVDYCQNIDSPVTISSFRAEFGRQLQQWHGASAAFQSWYSASQTCDFRPAIARNIQFLFKESVGVDETLRNLTIWSEILDMDHIKPHPQKETQTIVTKYVYDCFSHLQFSSFLKVVDSKRAVEERHTLLGETLHLTGGETPGYRETFIQDQKSQGEGTYHPSGGTRPDRADHIKKVELSELEIGTVIAVTKDTNGRWKDEANRWNSMDDFWYFLITEILKHKTRGRTFHGIWLYKASDTACAKMKYPFPNELFLSDNCTCGDTGIRESEVLGVLDVDWHGQPMAGRKSFFIRQTYLENERFVTLHEEHKMCEHIRSEHDPLQPESVQRYLKGETVLAPSTRQQDSSNELEVYEVIQYDEALDQKTTVLLRRLQRRSMFEVDAVPNELVYTQIIDRIAPSRIHSTCSVRCFLDEEIIPAPYNRGGAGNMFYITQELVQDNSGTSILQALHHQPISLIQGFDPQLPVSKKKLVGMDLYCGGGNFGRGLEEGGAIETRYAVDLDKPAIHTYYANLPQGSKTKLYFGSVDDLLITAMQGNPQNDECVPLPGDVDFISAGSPCQGFSLLNPNKNNDKSLKNQSLVASVAAYADFYRPKYGVLENVVTMARRSKGRDEDVMSQLICALVGLGYQTHLILLDAWNSGSPQSRSRLFVSFAAPGLVPLEHPALSHSHPPGTRFRGLGKLANGESFGSRLHTATPFKYVSAEECFRDLPFIGDGMTGHCTKFPDHVTESLATESVRAQLQAIPLFPRGSNFASSWKGGNGRMSEADRSLFPPHIGRKGTPSLRVQPDSRAWERLKPDRLMGTVTVSLQLASARGSPSIHWNETRCLTLLEFRRAQSFPDNEILVGNRNQCMKLIGNSVARTVAVSLGLKLREAWLKNEDVPSIPIKAMTYIQLESMLVCRPASSVSSSNQNPFSAKVQHSANYRAQPIAQMDGLKRRFETLQDQQVFRKKVPKSSDATKQRPSTRTAPRQGRVEIVKHADSTFRTAKQALARSFAMSSASSSASDSDVDRGQKTSFSEKHLVHGSDTATRTTLSKLMTSAQLPKQRLSGGKKFESSSTTRVAQPDNSHAEFHQSALSTQTQHRISVTSSQVIKIRHSSIIDLVSSEDDASRESSRAGTPVPVPAPDVVKHDQ